MIYLCLLKVLVILFFFFVGKYDLSYNIIDFEFWNEKYFFRITFNSSFSMIMERTCRICSKNSKFKPFKALTNVEDSKFTFI